MSSNDTHKSKNRQVAELLKEARQKNGMKQATVADVAGVSVRWVNEVENGQLSSNPQTAPLVAVAAALDEKPETFLRAAGIVSFETAQITQVVNEVHSSVPYLLHRLGKRIEQQLEIKADLIEVIQLLDSRAEWRSTLINFIRQFNDLRRKTPVRSKLLADITEEGIRLELDSTIKRIDGLFDATPETFNDEIGDDLWVYMIQHAQTIWTTNCAVETPETGSSDLDFFLEPQKTAVKEGREIIRVFALSNRTLENHFQFRSVVQKQVEAGIKVFLTHMDVLNAIPPRKDIPLSSRDVMIMDDSVVHYSLMDEKRVRRQRRLSSEPADLLDARYFRAQIEQSGKIVPIDKEENTFEDALKKVRSWANLGM